MNFAKGPRAPLFCLALLALLYSGGASRAALGQSAGRPSVVDCESPAAAEAEAKLLRVVVVGDSIMWGQGLDDRYKFRYMVQRWLAEQTGLRVVEELHAHAGAIVKTTKELEGKAEYNLKSDWVPHEEVNFGYPTITEQVEMAAWRLGCKSEAVELVLMDGCINDFNFRYLLDVNKTVEDIERQTREKCGEPMKELLSLVTQRFPNALVVLTGYYPLIYRGDSDSGETTRPFGTPSGAGPAGRKRVGGTADNLLTREAIERLSRSGEENGAEGKSAGGAAGGGEGAPKKGCGGEPRGCLHLLSEAWYKTSNEVLGGVAEKANEKWPEKRVVFAELNYPPEFAFSTPQSMLWNIRFGSTNLEGLKKAAVVLLDGIDTFKPNDATREARARGCENAYRDMKNIHRDMKTRLKELSRDPKADEKEKERQRKLAESMGEFMSEFKLACKYGSLGHPNKYGSALYAQSIISNLKPFLPRLKEQRERPKRDGDKPASEAPTSR